MGRHLHTQNEDNEPASASASAREAAKPEEQTSARSARARRLARRLRLAGFAQLAAPIGILILVGGLYLFWMVGLREDFDAEQMRENAPRFRLLAGPGNTVIRRLAPLPERVASPGTSFDYALSAYVANIGPLEVMRASVSGGLIVDPAPALIALAATFFAGVPAWRIRKRAFVELARLRSAQQAGALAGALVVKDAGTVAAAEAALIRIFEDPSRFGLASWTPGQRRSLRFGLLHGSAPFQHAALHTYERSGDADDLRAVAQLAEPGGTRAADVTVPDAARRCLAAMEARLAQGDAPSTLLRSSQAPDTEPDELLRPAGPNEENVDPRELLRPGDGGI
jgi:hypothetical protein